ncbi:MAG: hypothetical protein ACRDY1_02090 [Acidimicrobiales bacterium]
MGAIIGVLIGYLLGVRAGDEGWAEFRESWRVITTSAEVRDLISGGLSIARELAGRGSEVLADRLNPSGSGALPLRPVA